MRMLNSASARALVSTTRGSSTRRLPLTTVSCTTIRDRLKALLRTFLQRPDQGDAGESPLAEYRKLARGARKAILEADPFFGTMAQSEGLDGLYDMFLGTAGRTFQGSGQVLTDIVRYADIALELHQPGFAAMLYWMIHTARTPIDPKNRKLVEDFLYCLEGLGVKDVKGAFPGDHEAEFKKIDVAAHPAKEREPLRVGARRAEGGAERQELSRSLVTATVTLGASPVQKSAPGAGQF